MIVSLLLLNFHNKLLPMAALMMVAEMLMVMDLLCIGCLNEHLCAADSTNAACAAWAEKHLNTVVTVSVLL